VSAAPPRRAGAGARPGAPPSLSPVLGTAGLLALQRRAGNQAVTALVQRAPAPTTTPAAYKTAADIKALNLAGFDSYAEAQADWARDPALSKTDRRDLVSVLEFARGGSPSPLGPCGDLLVDDLVKSKLGPAERARLRTYARGQRATDTAGVEKATTLAEADKAGDALTTLEAKVPRAILHKNMGETDEGKHQFAALLASGHVGALAAYWQRAHPALEANNGADIRSYLLMRDTDSKDPASYVGRLPYVRSYHRFLAEMLDALITNLGDTSRSKPLALILHTGSDHNGAFHRDDALKDAVKHPRNLTIMIEGPTSLEAAGDSAAAMAKRYGQRRRIEQVMLAGHGLPRSMDLAGVPDAKGGFRSDSLDLANNKQRTERFIRKLIANMASGPQARIVLNACLTAADEISGPLPADPGQAKAAILRSLTNKPSLAAQIAKLGRAKGVTVEGNVSSVPAGKYMETDAAGNPTGVFHQDIPSDPYATSTDRGDYIEFGVEPEGAVRALVALWALDRAECVKRVDARLKKPASGTWADRVIRTFYGFFQAAPDDIDFMNRIAAEAAGGLSEMLHPSAQTPGTLGGLSNAFSPAEEAKIIGPLYPHAPLGGRLALDVVAMIHDPTRAASLLAALGSFATVQDAKPHLDAGWLAPSMAALLPVASAAAPTKAQLLLALWGVTGDRSDASAAAFLRAGAQATLHVPVPAGTTVEGLTGSDSEDDVLTVIGLKGGDATPTNPVANVDTDGDGVNDTYVESITRHAVVTAKWLNVRAQPDRAAKRVDTFAAGTRLEVFGRSGAWLAVERPGGVGFVHQAWVRRRPVK
jgi:hypothetical protein